MQHIPYDLPSSADTAVPGEATPGLPHVFNCATLARYLEVDLKTVQALAQQGEIPCRKVGKAYRFFAPAVIKWLLGPHTNPRAEP